MENRNSEQDWRPNGPTTTPRASPFFPTQWYATVIYTLLPFRCANIPYCRNSEMALLPGAFVRRRRGIFPRARWTWNSVILTMNTIPSTNNFQVQFTLNLGTLKSGLYSSYFKSTIILNISKFYMLLYTKKKIIHLSN